MSYSSKIPSSEILYKVTGFITRRIHSTELLVFQHPSAGVQLPAGTVEDGEAVEDAAFREVAEETGLTQVRLVANLGSLTTDLGEERRACLRATTLLAGPSADAPPLRWQFGRGSPCRVVDVVNGFAEVIYEETNFNINPPTVQLRFSGWIPANVLTRTLERHFYHFESTGPTAERWVQEAERDFACYWVPLSPQPKLVEGQQEWLDFVYAKLTL